MNKITVMCDLTSKKWLNMEEAITYLGFGSKRKFQEWRETGELTYYKPGKIILYKRTDLDNMMEQYKNAAFANTKKTMCDECHGAYNCPICSEEPPVEDCEYCDGTGFDPENPGEDCPECLGLGYKRVDLTLYYEN